jgi:hypothetical protein
MVADEVVSEAADDGHVLCAMAGPVMRAVHIPNGRECLCRSVDVERRGGDVGASVEDRAVGVLVRVSTLTNPLMVVKRGCPG